MVLGTVWELYNLWAISPRGVCACVGVVCMETRTFLGKKRPRIMILL